MRPSAFLVLAGCFAPDRAWWWDAGGADRASPVPTAGDAGLAQHDRPDLGRRRVDEGGSCLPLVVNDETCGCEGMACCGLVACALPELACLTDGVTSACWPCGGREQECCGGVDDREAWERTCRGGLTCHAQPGSGARLGASSCF